MVRKKRAKKKAPSRAKRVRLTPAAFIGLVIGVLMVVLGLSPGPDAEALGGYYIVALGVVFIIVVAWITVKKKY